MDFKVAGTHKGITAIQMDIKIHGLTRPIIEEAIAATKKARTYILDEVMNKAIAEPRKEVGTYAPKIIQMQIDPQKIGDVVGQRGKTINAIIKEFGAFLEFAPGKEGMVHISKISKERVNKVEDVLNIGDVVKVVCLGKDKMGRFSFSMKDVAE